MAKAIIVDLDRTVYDPVTDCLYDGVAEALEKFRGLGYSLILVGRASAEQLALVEKLSLRQTFSEVILNGEQTRDIFREILRRHQAKAGKSYVIGGRVKVEITIGNELQAKTIWFKQGNQTSEPPENYLEIPYFATSNWQEIARLISN